MNEFYPQEAAGKSKVIDEWTTPLKNVGGRKDFMHQITLINRDDFTVKNSSSTTTVIVGRQTGLNAAAIFTVVGVLKLFDLPPVKRNSLTAARVPYARAYAEVVGYDSSHFATALANVKDLAYDLSTKFPADCVEHWIASPDSDIFGPGLGSSCRYYTMGGDIPGESRITFQNHIDPAGTLSQHLSERVAHCVENDVAYLCLKKNKYATKDPSGFRLGDIVEMGFELVAFRQTKRGEDEKHICKVVLRMLTPLDGSFAKAAFNARADAEQAGKSVTASQKKPKQAPAKRRLDFADLSSDDEDSADTRQRMAGLRLNDTSEKTAQSTDDAKMENSQNSV
ncbi:hypothetical protein B0H17DRAFT_1146416 [Mycena rosella]|uniref:Uncharacterized protein n=1 Tax=Mycena rosella TaxID=1033263 RepID=A0AAD7G4W5_MYCRO|nr:hypothetical protein B0H17DRAFT_1146416 [Mycena rosella]